MTNVGIRPSCWYHGTALLLFLLVGDAAAAEPPNPNEQAVSVPPGITYKPASPEINARAKGKLGKVFGGTPSHADILALFGGKVICGPGLWQKIQSNDKIQKVPGGKVTLNVPTMQNGQQVGKQQLSGKLFQSENDVLLLWDVLKATYNFKNYKIRKLNPLELRIYWAMISFDIEEPIFILETAEADLLVNLVGPELHILWIDDFRDMSMRPAQAGRGQDAGTTTKFVKSIHLLLPDEIIRRNFGDQELINLVKGVVEQIEKTLAAHPASFGGDLMVTWHTDRFLTAAFQKTSGQVDQALIERLQRDLESSTVKSRAEDVAIRLHLEVP